MVSSISNMKHMCGVYHSNFDISVLCGFGVEDEAWGDFAVCQ